MGAFAFFCLFIIVQALPSAAQCPVVGGMVLPCGRPVAQAVPSESGEPQAPREQAPETPLFTAAQVAPDTSPQQLALLNEPTWDNAVDAAIISLYRNLRALEATYMMDAARRAIVVDIEQRTGLSQLDIMAFLQATAQAWGLPTADLRGIPPPILIPGMDDRATAKLLSDAMNQGTRKGK